ncbi:MAG: uncharacterized protein KVP18_001662 [Porospora cf. gigantea A]|uniref:uncharacterized protein n=2 Tax=Porospora cf. gigantea A TaxID=2853593 RepID=UPI003559DBCB|nr:MAG: hypothetical protein KVP18_001662 [Porospora cf. gigantea A]
MAEVDSNVEQWKVKRLIKTLESARGNGTSMISLIIRPKDELSRITKMLGEEAGTAVNIKSRVNRLSVQSAIGSTIQKLKLYNNRTPTNGLVVYCGTVLNDEGKERKIAIDFEPFKPINTSLYLCDNKFHVDCLKELLESDDKYGFIIMDGNGALFGTLQGNTRDVIHKFSVELPKKHGRGGQSAPRFARIRMEKRHHYVRKVTETAVQCFISNDKINVNGLILAGSAEFKNELAQSQMFDIRLASKVMRIVDVSYGGENGFNQAIEQTQDFLANVKFVHEKKIIGHFFEEIAVESGKHVYGIAESIQALETGAVEQLICFENLDVNRLVMRNPQTGEENVLYLTDKQERNRPDMYKDKATGVELELADRMTLTEWLCNRYKDFGAKLEFVSDKSQEGNQFCQGFGGIGGILRYQIDFQEYEDFAGDDDDLDFI